MGHTVDREPFRKLPRTHCISLLLLRMCRQTNPQFDRQTIISSCESDMTRQSAYETYETAEATRYAHHSSTASAYETHHRPNTIRRHLLRVCKRLISSIRIVYTWNWLFSFILRHVCDASWQTCHTHSHAPHRRFINKTNGRIFALSVCGGVRGNWKLVLQTQNRSERQQHQQRQLWLNKTEDWISFKI